MKTFNLEIVTPTSKFDYENISYLRLPSYDGLFGVQYSHADAIIGLDIGEVKITIDNKEQYLAIGGGFIEISKNNMTLLVETAEQSKDIDKKRAENALKNALEKINQSESAKEVYEQAIKRAKNRIKISQKNS